MFLGAAFTGATTFPAGLEVTVGVGPLASEAATAGLDVVVGLDAFAGLAAWASRRWCAPAAGPQRKGVAVVTSLVCQTNA